MYEDDPQDRVFDLLGEAVFGAHPLGRRGDRHARGRRRRHARAAAGLPRRALPAAEHRDRGRRVGRPRRARGDGAGRRRRADRAGGAARGQTRSGSAPQPAEPAARPVPRPRRRTSSARVRFLEKDTEQYHVCLGGAGIARDDERRFALRVLEGVLGGTSSSRLFQEVRERRGLAYSVFCSPTSTPTRARWGCTWARARRTSPRRCRSSRRELERCVRGPRQRARS